MNTKEKKAFVVCLFLKERKNEKKNTAKNYKREQKEFGKREEHVWQYEFEISIERCGCVQSEYRRVTLNASNLFYLKTFAFSLLFTHKYLTHT